MSIADNYGPLIETGEIDGFTYEVRNPAYPMVYIYREVSGKIIGDQTQLGGSPVGVVVRSLISGLPKAVKDAS